MIPGGRGISSNYSEGLPAQMVLGGWRWLPANISPDALRAMLTVRNTNGEEQR